MKPITIRGAAIAAVLLGFATAPTSAAEPMGTWLTEGGKSTVRIAGCGAALCGTIVSLKEPNDAEGRPKTDKNNTDASKRGRPVVGVQVVVGMKPDGPNKWSGQVYNPEDGKTYSGSTTLENAKTIKVQGCILGGMVCKTSTWTRT